MIQGCNKLVQPYTDICMLLCMYVYCVAYTLYDLSDQPYIHEIINDLEKENFNKKLWQYFLDACRYAIQYYSISSPLSKYLP